MSDLVHQNKPVVFMRWKRDPWLPIFISSLMKKDPKVAYNKWTLQYRFYGIIDGPQYDGS